MLEFASAKLQDLCSLLLRGYMSPIKVRSEINGFVTLDCVVETSYGDRSERKISPIVIKMWIPIVPAEGRFSENWAPLILVMSRVSNE